MIVRQITTNPAQPLKSPFRETSGITIALRGGDVCHPRGDGNWFEPPYFPDGIVRFFWPLWTSILLLVVELSAVFEAVRVFGWWGLLSVPLLLANPGLFLSWRLGDRGGYFGAKTYGADSPAYKNYMQAGDIFDGSIAIHYSARLWSELPQVAIQ